MKYSIFIFLLAVVGFSCSEDDIVELADIEQDFSFEESITIDEETETEISESTTLDISSDLSGLSSNLKSIEIATISAVITDFEGDDDRTLESFSIAFDLGGSILTLSIDEPLALNASTNASFSLSSSDVDFAALNAILLNSQEVTITVSGTVDQAPVEFDADITIEGRLTANPLS